MHIGRVTDAAMSDPGNWDSMQADSRGKRRVLNGASAPAELLTELQVREIVRAGALRGTLRPQLECP
jgi:hypothetical protein